MGVQVPLRAQRGEKCPENLFSRAFFDEAVLNTSVASVESTVRACVCDEAVLSIRIADFLGRSMGGMVEQPIIRDSHADPDKPEELVQEFHSIYGLPVTHDTPCVDRERVHMRMKLIAEEFSELVGAVYGSQARATVENAYKEAVHEDDHSRNVIETADALGDITYVVYGMALEMGIPMREVMREIQASNLSKLGDDGRPIYRSDGKVMKGSHYFPPNIARALGLEDLEVETDKKNG